MSGSYDRLDGDRARTVRDHTTTWERLRTLEQADQRTLELVTQFCERKRITVEALEQLGTRITHRDDLGWCLAYAGTNGNGVVVAIKYRPINGSSHDSLAERPSVWLRPIMVGNRDSLDWLIAEGETDAARLFGLVGDWAAILVLPAGARTFKPEWAKVIPRGATVALCHDADEDGDAGAEKAAEIIGGRTVRVRPPQEGVDWCDWDGDRDAFLRLARPRPQFEFATYIEFSVRDFPAAEPLLGESGRVFLATGSLFMVYGADGSAKSTWTIDGFVHLAAGVAWLGVPVPRPARVCIIENEGPPSLFQQKLRDKIATWEGPDPSANLFVFAAPWGEFTFRDPDARAALREFCDEHHIDLVTANPTLGLGVGASGRPDETQEFVDLLVECGLKRDRAFWLLHHENKQGQISGDWGRHPDTHVWLQRDGNRQRTKLTWSKTRWATLEPDEKSVLLEWITETWGYNVIKLDAVASDAELVELIDVYLTAHPAVATRLVHENVPGRNSRISTILKDRFDCVSGPRNAKLWLPRRDAVGTKSQHRDAVGTQWGENPDE